MRKPSTEEPSEKVDRDLEDGRPSSSSSSEASSNTNFVEKSTLPKPKWWGPQKRFNQSKSAGRLLCTIRSGLQRCTGICLGFFLAAFVILFVSDFLGYRLAAN